MLCPLPTSTLFPYTTLFRSDVISQRPLDWARLGLGKIQLAEQDYDAAIATFKALLEDNNQCIEAYDWLAQAYQKQGHLQKAQSTLKQAVEISPRDRKSVV